MGTEEFWGDDAAAVQQREAERASGLRMPKASDTRIVSTGVTDLRIPAAAMPDKPKAASSGVYIVLAAMAIVAAMVALRSDGRSDGSEQRAAAIYGTATESEMNDLNNLVQIGIDGGVILKIESTGSRADLYVLPGFHAATVDDKTKVIRICYLQAFRLPLTTRWFPRSMAVMDGITGERLRTVDMEGMGTRW